MLIKKIISLLLSLVAMLNVLMAQDVITLRFTAADKNDNSYITLQTIQVENVTRGWKESVSYPDTILQLTCGVIGIEDVQATSNFLKVYSHVSGQNPSIEISMAKAGKVQFEVFDIMGRVVIKSSDVLERGVYMYDLQLQNAGIYIVRAVTAQGSSSAKVLNTAYAAGNGMELMGMKQTELNAMPIPLKKQSLNPFLLGDEMRYIGYIIVDGKLYKSDVITRQQNTDEDFTLLFDTVATPPVVAFSVSSNRMVDFAPGNLQYKASTNEWRFAENQWESIKSANKNISPTYDGWIDLFGWGTSGWDNGNKYYQPYDFECSVDISHQYGPVGAYDLTGAYANSDWGVYNRSKLGGDEWRTLSHEEWVYLLNTRPDAANLRSQGSVNGEHGIILLPDIWLTPEGVSFVANARNWTTNSYSVSQWEIMESNGAIFLPAAGYRAGKEVGNFGGCGYYRSSSCISNKSTYSFFFDVGVVNPSDTYFRSWAQAVRLVKVVAE